MSSGAGSGWRCGVVDVSSPTAAQRLYPQLMLLPVTTRLCSLPDCSCQFFSHSLNLRHVIKRLKKPSKLLMLSLLHWDSDKLSAQQFSPQYLPATRPIYQAQSAACPGPALHMLLQCKACSQSPEESVRVDLRALESVGCYFCGGAGDWALVPQPLNRQNFH